MNYLVYFLCIDVAKLLSLVFYSLIQTKANRPKERGIANTMETSSPSISPYEDFLLDDAFNEFISLDASPDDLILDDDCRYLNDVDKMQIQAAVLDEDWSDCKISSPGESVEFHLDTARKEAWNSFTDEIGHLRARIPTLLKEMNVAFDDSGPFTNAKCISHLFQLAFGEKSDVSRLLCKELSIDRQTLCRFLGTLCLQMSYKETPLSLFDKYSELKMAVLCDKEKYIDLWKTIANKKKVHLTNYVGTSRRFECLWEMMERTVNSFLRNISIAGRTDEIIIALDDDKIWVESSGSNQLDDFGLRKVTHVKDNRKGIIAHTAVSSTTNLPLCFMFERRGDSAVDCFKRIFGHLFPSSNPSNLPDLNGIRNHSDRGYTLESTVFNFLLPAGADFTNTVRQVMPFPFYWSARSHGNNDPREKLSEKGAPTLYIKEILKNNRLVSCSAFRTGTQNISTVISTVIHGHQWEGVCRDQKERLAYEEDPEHGLDHLSFAKLAEINDGNLINEDDQEKIDAMFQTLKNEKINILTVDQGTADWFKGRQFSLTSRQSFGAYMKAFIINQQEDSWCDVAESLYGRNYHLSKLILFCFDSKTSSSFLTFFISIVQRSTVLLQEQIVLKSRAMMPLKTETKMKMAGKIIITMQGQLVQQGALKLLQLA